MIKLGVGLDIYASWKHGEAAGIASAYGQSEDDVLAFAFDDQSQLEKVSGTVIYEEQGGVDATGALSGSAAGITNTSPSLKATRQADGLVYYQAHNLYLNSETPADQAITVIAGATYLVEITGAVSVTASGAASGTWTAGTHEFTAATTTLTLGSTSGGGTVHMRRTPSVPTYIKTTDAIVIDLPYVYDLDSGERRGLLIEADGQNVWTQSNNPGNAAFQKFHVSVGADGDDPGLGPLKKVVEDATTNEHNLYRVYSGFTSGTTYVHSVLAKAGERTFLDIICVTGLSIHAVFDLSDGSVTEINGTAMTEYWGAGVWRCSVGNVAAATQAGNVQHRLSTNGSDYASYAGDGTSGLYLGHFQLEARPAGVLTPSSLMQTFTTTPVRNKDRLTRDPLPFTVGSGTLIVEGEVDADVNSSLANYYASLSDGGDDNTVLLIEYNGFRSQVITEGVVQADITLPPAPTGNICGLVTWETDGVKVAREGDITSEDTSATIPDLTTLVIGRDGSELSGTALEGIIKRVALLPRRVTDLEARIKSVQSSTHVIVADGDSLTAQGGNNSWPRQLVPALGIGYGSANISVAGQTLEDMESDAAGSADALLSAFAGRATLIAWGGTNDIGVDDVSLSTLQSRWTAYFSARQAAGWGGPGTRLVALTLTDRDDLAGPQRALLDDFNTWLRANYSTYATHLVDTIADPRLADASNATYFNGDTLHLTDAGRAVIVELLLDVFD